MLEQTQHLALSWSSSAGEAAAVHCPRYPETWPKTPITSAAALQRDSAEFDGDSLAVMRRSRRPCCRSPSAARAGYGRRSPGRDGSPRVRRPVSGGERRTSSDDSLGDWITRPSEMLPCSIDEVNRANAGAAVRWRLRRPPPIAWSSDTPSILLRRGARPQLEDAERGVKPLVAEVPSACLAVAPRCTKPCRVSVS